MIADRPIKCDVLNERERTALHDLFYRYNAARMADDYATSDKLRDELTAKGMDTQGRWQAVFESQDARVNRLAARYVYGEP